MKNPRIGEELMKMRIGSGHSVKQVMEYLHERGIKVATKTIYGWEVNTSQPDAHILMELCCFFGVDDVLATFGYRMPEDTNRELSDLKIAYMREPDPNIKKAVRKLLGINGDY